MTTTEPRARSARVEADLELLRQIPRQPQDYNVVEADALQHFGLDHDLLAALRGAGLSRADGDGLHAYARCDVHFIGVRLGLARSHLWAMSLWRRALLRFASSAATRVGITYRPQLPQATGPVSGSAMLPGGRARAVLLRHDESAAEIAVTMRRDWPRPPADVVEVVEDVGALGHCLLPRHVRGDAELARRLGVVDCWTAANMIVDGCRRQGRSARVAYGLLVAVPLSSEHAWAEVELGGRWTPFDPTMIDAMRRHAGLDPGAWPRHRSLGPLLARILRAPERNPALVTTAAGESVATTYLTRFA